MAAPLSVIFSHNEVNCDDITSRGERVFTSIKIIHRVGDEETVLAKSTIPGSTPPFSGKANKVELTKEDGQRVHLDVTQAASFEHDEAVKAEGLVENILKFSGTTQFREAKFRVDEN